MYILFRRLVTATPDSTIAPFVALSEYWDNEKRTVYRDQEASQLNDPSEVAIDTELARYAVRPGLARVVRYLGDGQIYTQDEGVTGGPGAGGVCTLAAPYIAPNPAATSDGASGDASVTVTCYQGVQPYEVVLRMQNDPVVVATATSLSTAQPVQFGTLNPGRFQITVTDAVGCTRTALFDVFGGAGTRGPYGPDLRVTYSYANGLYRTFWNPITKMVENFQVPPDPNDNPNNPDYDNKTPAGQPVDGYMLADGYTWRVVASDGQGGVVFSDSDTRKPGLLELHNLIIFHPDRPQDATGAVLVECNATDYPLSFQLGDGTGTAIGPANTTGRFDGLTADTYEVVVTDAEGRTLAVPFSLRARYGKRWELVADNLYSKLWAVEIWQIGYTGPVEPIIGEGEAPVRLKSDGLNSAIGGQGDIPAAIGTSCELALLATVEQLADVQLGSDRDFRVDLYCEGALEFRGYITPDIYTADLQYGLVPVSLTATDGLAALKDTVFTGHVNQFLSGRWPLYNTLAHCLSRCDVSLPVRIATNRRPAELATNRAPELFLLTERAGYASLDKNEPLDMRQVVEAIAQLLGGTLVQRNGQWEIRSVNEAAGLITRARAYKPAGTSLNVQSIGAPTGLIRPSQTSYTAGAGWFWGGDQTLSIRAGWKSLAVATDAGYAANALPAGDVFGDDTAWNQSLDALLPTAGWSENTAAPGFPLVLERAGEKNTDLGTRWPRKTSVLDERYLQSGTLPNSPEMENIPWSLKVTGRVVALDAMGNVLILPPTPGQSRSATITLEVVTDGQRPAVPVYATFNLADSGTPTDTTLTFPLGPLPAQSRISRLRVSPWDGTTLPNVVLLIKKIAIVLLPQGATWDGKDNFRADSNRGTVRPTDTLQVFHPDAPLKAGLFEANAFAFRRAVSLVGGALTTVWSRPTDLQSAPLLESAAYDGLALRAAPSRLLKGTVHYYKTAPPRMLDTVDAPDDLDGRRFVVASVDDNLRAGEVVVSLVEAGVGTRLSTLDPLAGYPNGVRLLDGVSFPVGAPVIPGQGRPRVRATDKGVRIASTD